MSDNEERKTVDVDETEKNSDEKNLLIIPKKHLDSKLGATKLKSLKDLNLFVCECGNAHFRHAGYLESLVPWIAADKKTKIQKDSVQVMICTSCKKAFVWFNEKMYDVTGLVDIKAWEKTERECQQMTGPGGEC